MFAKKQGLAVKVRDSVEELRQKVEGQWLVSKAAGSRVQK